MKEKTRKLRGILVLLLLMVLSANSHLLMSVATDDNLPEEQVKAQATIETSLEKYVNYELEDQKGTIIQLEVKTGIEYQEEQEPTPIRASGIVLNAPKIENSFPESVELVDKNTKLTNGDNSNAQHKLQYNAEEGKIVVVAFNTADENGEIYSNYQEGDKDTYTLVLNYGEAAFNSENVQREITIDGGAAYEFTDSLSTKAREYFENTIQLSENIGNLVTTNVTSQEVYNGYIKTNKTSENKQPTSYKEAIEINISKTNIAEKTQIEITNSFEKQNEEKIDTEDIVYTSSAINKENVLKILGEEGNLVIRDQEGNTIGELNKETQVNEKGQYEITYPENISKITIEYTNPQSLGKIQIINTKQIKESVEDTLITKIIQTHNINGYEESHSLEVKESTTQVNLELNTKEWTNEKQNNVSFKIEMPSNDNKYNLFKDPSIAIQLPQETEKVILNEPTFVNGNGLEIASVNYNEETKIITIELQGEQTKRQSPDFISGASIELPATIILSSDIENKDYNLELAYINNNTINGDTEKGIITETIKLINFKVEEEEPQIDLPQLTMVRNARMLAAPETAQEQTQEGLAISVKALRGDAELTEENKTVYEGEFIKYEITVANTTEEDIENAKIVATLPDGVTYGELVREDHEPEVESYYNFDVALQPIELGTIKAGKTATAYFEVQVNDLADGETSKDITTNIKAYIGEALSDNYSITHKVEEAEYKVFLGEKIFLTNEFKYILKVEGDSSENVNVNVKLPECMKANKISSYNSTENYYQELNNVSEFNVELKPGEYLIYTKVSTKDIEKNGKNYSTEVKAIATVNNKYKSNENRTLVEYYQFEITMTSENEGEEIKYGEEINYEIKLKLNGKVNFTRDNVFCAYVKLSDMLPDELEPIEIVYNNFKLNEEYDSEDENSQIFIETTDITKQISGKKISVSGEEPTIYQDDLLIPIGETITVQVKTKAGIVLEKTTITNSAALTENTLLSANDPEIDTQLSNVVSHTILPYDYKEPSDEPIDPDNQTEPENPENPDEPEIPSEPAKPENPSDEENETNKYVISGYVWEDENEDGAKQSSEKVISGIQACLVKDNASIIKKTITNENGAYNFEEIEAGEYLVLFKYDNNQYRVTKYKVNGVGEGNNSNATSQNVTIEGESIVAAVTEEIELNSNISNINLGLIKNKKFDFSIENYISKVTVKTKNNTEEKTYNNTNLAKTEIKAKEIDGATIEVQYKIIVTNNGELAGTVNRIIDTLPEGFVLDTVSNTTWVKNDDGTLLNTSLANRAIEAGKSVELTLIVTKELTENSTGTFTNNVKIDETINDYNTEEISMQNNSSKAELIISISTGVLTYLIIGIVIISIILILLNAKYNIFRKIKVRFFVLALAIGITAFMQANINPSKAQDMSDEYNQKGYLTKNFYLTAIEYGPTTNVKMGNNTYTLRYRWEDSYKNSKHLCIIRNWDNPSNSYSISAKPIWHCAYEENGNTRILKIYNENGGLEYNLGCSDTDGWSSNSWNHIKTSGGTVGLNYGMSNIFYFERDWRVFLSTKDDGYPNYPISYWSGNEWRISTSSGIGPSGPSSIGGICIDYNADGGDYSINVSNLGYGASWLVDSQHFYQDVNAYQPLTYTWNGVWDGSPSQAINNSKDLNSWSLEGQSDYENIQLKLEGNSYIMGPFKITNNWINVGGSITNNNEYTFSITAKNGNTIWTDDIKVCAYQNGNGEYSKTQATYHGNSGDYTQNVTRIGINRNFYLKVDKTAIDNGGGVGYIKIYAKTNYRYKKDIHLHGVGVWYNSGHQRIASPVDIDINDESDWTFNNEITFDKVQGTIRVRKIDQYNGDSNLPDILNPNSSNCNLAGIQFQIYTLNGSTKEIVNWDNNYNTGGSNTVLTTDKWGYTPTIVGLDPNKVYYVDELYIPEQLWDYYKNERENEITYTKDSDGRKADLNSGQFALLEGKNYRDYTSIKIHKTDSANHNLQGIDFTIHLKSNTSKIMRVDTNGIYYDMNGGMYSIVDSNNNFYKISTTESHANSSGKCYVFETDSSGNTIEIKRVPLGIELSLYELDVGNYSNLYKTGFVKEFKTASYASGVYNINHVNDQVYGALQIIKRETQTKAPLQGIQFKINVKQKSSGTYKSIGWLKYNTSTKKCIITTTMEIDTATNFNDATVLTTNANGETPTILKIPIADKDGNPYKFDIYATYIPASLREYFTLDTTDLTERYEPITMGGDAARIATSILEVADVQLVKKVKNQSPYNEAEITYPTNLTNADLFAWNSNPYIKNDQAYITISGNVWEEHLRVKTITGEINNLYKADNNDIDKDIKGITVSLVDSDDKIVTRIIVNKNGNPTLKKQTAETDSNGKYTFTNVKIRELENYRIQFTYDGITYESVIPYAGKSQNEYRPVSNTSKAEETKPEEIEKYNFDKSLREEFNKKWSNIVGYNQSIKNLDNEDIALKYTKDSNVVRLSSDILCNRTESTNGKYVTIGTNKGKFLINAYTEKEKLDSYYNYILQSDYISKNKRQLLKQIENINLGLYQREMPNLTLQKDVYKADLSINGKTYTYMYNQKIKMNNPTDTSLGVDFEGDYSLPIYKADVNYNDEATPSNNLQGTITYKIKLQNASTNLNATIDSINELYSDKLTLNKMYLSSNPAEKFDDPSTYQELIERRNYWISDYEWQANGHFSGNLNNESFVQNNTHCYAQNIRFINSIKLGKAAGSTGDNTKYLYVEFIIKDIKDCYDNEVKFRNYAEIGSYTVYGDKTTGNIYVAKNRYAGVDSTSIPNNYNPVQASQGMPENISNITEDDCDNGLGLQIVDAGTRTLSGAVFEDTPVKKISFDGIEYGDTNGNGQIDEKEERIGNGIYDTSPKSNNIGEIADKPIPGVRVQFIDTSTGELAKLYYPEHEKPDGTKGEFAVPGGTFEDGTKADEIITSEDGTFSLEGFIPGNYQVVYIWGKDYGGKDVTQYKGTIFVNPTATISTQGVVTLPGNWYNIRPSIRYSDAIDDYIRRLAIDREALGIPDVDEDGNSNYTAAEKEKMDKITDLSYMVSPTAKMTIGIEKDVDENGNGIYDNSSFPLIKGGREKLDFKIANVDFGIIERPRQGMNVSKKVKSLKLTTSEGRPVVIATIGVDGKVNAIAGESYISGGYELGYLMAQIDKNIQQDMKVEIEYEITVSCSSEIDYDNQYYYEFGNERNDPLKLRANYLYDYLGGSNVSSDDKNHWETVSGTTQYITTKFEDIVPTTTEQEFLEIYNSGENIGQYIENEYKYAEKAKATITDIFEKWATEIQGNINEQTLRNEKIGTKEILTGNSENELTKDPYESGDKRTESLISTKIISNGDEAYLTNDVEIATVTVDKSQRTGRKVDAKTSYLYDRANYATVTPATGEDRDYVGWTIVAIGILTIFASGIILIKRFLSKK